MTDSPLARWERHNGAVLAVASLLYLSSYAIRVLGHGLPGPVRDVCLAVTLVTWLVFLVDYVVRLRLSGQRLPRFLRTHWLDTVVLLLPQVPKVTGRILENGGATVSGFIVRRFGGGELNTSALMAAGLVLFGMTLVTNMLASVIISRSRSGVGVEV